MSCEKISTPKNFDFCPLFVRRRRAFCPPQARKNKKFQPKRKKSGYIVPNRNLTEEILIYIQWYFSISCIISEQGAHSSKLHPLHAALDGVVRLVQQHAHAVIVGGLGLGGGTDMCDLLWLLVPCGSVGMCV